MNRDYVVSIFVTITIYSRIKGCNRILIVDQRQNYRSLLNEEMTHFFTPQWWKCVCIETVYSVSATILILSSVHECLFIYRLDLTGYCLEILVLAQFVSFKQLPFPLTAILLCYS